MKNNNIIIALGVTICLLTITGVFADSNIFNDNQDIKGSNESQLPPPPRPFEGSGSMNKGIGQGPNIKAFLKTDLTKTDMDAIKVILDTHREAKQKLDGLTSSGNTDNKEAKKLLDDKLFLDMTPYITEGQMDAFKQDFLKNKPNPQDKKLPKEKPQLDKNDNGEKGPGIIKQAKLLPDSIETVIDTKLATFTSNEEKITWLNNLVTKIDASLTKVKGEKIKLQLTELKDLLNNKIDSINGVGIDDNELINSLLEE